MRGLNKKMRWRLMAAIATTAIGIGFSGAAAAADFPAKAKKAAPSIWERDTLTGDWGGARTSLKNQGIDITLNYIGEIFGVMSGGLERRASYEGQLEFSVDTDLDKLIGWTGASTHVTIFQIHDSGHNVLENVGSIADPSNIDALPTTRLYTAWFEQKFSDLLSVRVGQLAGDGDFATGPTGGGLINGTFGWASLMAANITNGGPAYPLATPGVRIKVNATDNLTVLGAVFAGNPAGNDCFDDPQACDRYGTRFSLAGGALWMGEVQYKVNQGKNAAGLPGIYKLGAWYATADYPDQHFGIDSTGAQISLGVDPTADPVQHRGDWGIYGVADQMVWRGHDSSMNLFVRGGLTPSDRNLISYYVDGGAGITGLLPGRANDVLTFGVAYAKISKDAIAADQDALGVNGPPSFIRDEEVVFELSYAAQVAPWWVVQPDLQYIVHPGGNVADPNDPNSTIQNAFIAGIRSTIKF